MQRSPYAHALTRRRFVTSSGALLGALAFAHQAPLAFAEPPAAAAPAAPLEHLIVLWMAGGPSQIDTFDPKPGRKTGGPFKAIPTAVDGITFSEHLPLLAKEAKDLCVVRSVTSKEAAHERGIRLVQTGYPPSATVDHPHVGAWLVKKLGEPENHLPAFVSIGASTGSGFLGPRLQPFLVRDVNRPVTNLVSPVPAARQSRRDALLAALAHAFPGHDHAPVVAAQRAARERAKALMASPALSAFELGKEDEKKRKAYGTGAFGKGCLLARRLVEEGVKVVHVTLGGWDNHRQAFPALKRLLGQVDPAFSSLVKDLRERDLLAKTLVVWGGEFGRTPDINATAGRDHYSKAFSMVLAGGGVPGGQVVGKTDDEGRKIVEDPVSPPEILASILTLGGVDLLASVTTGKGRPIWPVPKTAHAVPALLPPALRT